VPLLPEGAEFLFSRAACGIIPARFLQVIDQARRAFFNAAHSAGERGGGVVRRSSWSFLGGAVCLAVLLTRSGGAGSDARAAETSVRAPVAPASISYTLTVTPDVVTAGQHVGGSGEPALTFEFAVSSTLRGGGLPFTINTGYDRNRSVLQIELPMTSSLSIDTGNVSTGAGLFDKPLLCRKDETACTKVGQDGYWKAVQIRPGGAVRELQLAVAQHDPIALLPYPHILGVYLPAWQFLTPGDRVRLSYTGKLPDRSTDWTGHPLQTHFRYRSFRFAADGTPLPGPWTMLSDDEVQPLTITALPEAAFVRAMAPLDIQAGAPFNLSVVVTDRFGNPRTITGEVPLNGGVTGTLQFQDEWRKDVTEVYPVSGSYRIVASFPPARSVYHYSRVWDGVPPVQRLVGDLHMHSGDGGEQRKFLGWVTPGDHMALFTRAHDALDYLRNVAGADFGALTEHSVRWDEYQLPPAAASDPQFMTGGKCTGEMFPIHGLGDWWTYAQGIARQYDAEAAGSFIVFPAFEWHSHHITSFVVAFLHRVALFRDFDSQDALPILPGDIRNLPPQCLARFFNDVGYGPDRVLVIPHMMSANALNFDWDFSYQFSTVAPRSLVESYQRVGELFSARAYNQGGISSTPYYGRDAWTVFEGNDATPGVWSYRYGWRNRGAHIGVVGASDNHTQMPGVNDDMAPDGSRYHLNEPSGATVTLAASRDRGGVFDALEARRSYATTGVRAWLAFDVDGSPMGSEIRRSVDQISAAVDLMAGMTITRVEVWGVQAGSPLAPYQLIRVDAPNAEIHSGTVALTNPVPAGGPPQEWLYYVRAFLETSGAEDGEPDDTVWSSPVWVTWSR